MTRFRDVCFPTAGRRVAAAFAALLLPGVGPAQASTDAGSTPGQYVASIVFDARPVEAGMTFERRSTKHAPPSEAAGQHAWKAYGLTPDEPGWVRSFRFHFTDERFKNGNSPIVDIDFEYRLDAWSGVAVFADTQRGSTRVGEAWGASPEWQKASYALEDAVFSRRDHGVADDQLASDRFDLRLFGGNGHPYLRRIRVTGYDRTGPDVIWSRMLRVERPVPTDGEVHAYRRGTPVAFEVPVRNLALDTAEVRFEATIQSYRGEVLATQRSTARVAGEGEAAARFSFDSTDWPLGGYRADISAVHADSGEVLRTMEVGLGVHSDATLAKAGPGELLYGLQHFRNPTGAPDQDWFELMGADILRLGMFGHGRGPAEEAERARFFESRGMHVLAIVDPPKPGSPTRYVPEGMDPDQRAEALEKLTGRMRALAEAAPQIRYWEMGNEPDLKFFYPGPVTEYVDSYRQMRSAIKSVRPDAVVMPGGLCFHGDDGKARAREIISLIRPGELDAWAYHGHGPGYRYEKLNYDRIRAVAEEFGTADVPFIETESGVSADSPAALMEQARTCVEKFAFAHEHAMPLFIWFGLHFDAEGQYTSVMYRREPRPVIFAYRNMVEQVRGLRYVRTLVGDETQRAMFFRSPDGRRAALLGWRDGGDAALRLRLGGGADAATTRHIDLFGNATGWPVNDRGVGTWTLGEDPSYVTWEVAAGTAEVELLDNAMDLAVAEAVTPGGSTDVSATIRSRELAGREAQLEWTLRPIGGDAPPTRLTVRARLDETGSGQARGTLDVADRDAAAVWPTSWRLYVPAGNRRVDARDFAAGLPESLGGDPGRWVEMPENRRLFIHRLTDRFAEKDEAWLATRVWSPRTQTVTVSAGADWWMAWFVNGERVFDTLERGNEGPSESSAHSFEIELERGWNTLAARVLAGSKGWVLAFADPDARQIELLGGSQPYELEAVLRDGQGFVVDRASRAVAAAPRIAPAADMTHLDAAAMTRQLPPKAVLDELHVVNAYVQTPQRERWWQGPQDLSATVHASSRPGAVRVLIRVRDDQVEKNSSAGDRVTLWHRFPGRAGFAEPRTLLAQDATPTPDGLLYTASIAVPAGVQSLELALRVADVDRGLQKQSLLWPVRQAVGGSPLAPDAAPTHGHLLSIP